MVCGLWTRPSLHYRLGLKSKKKSKVYIVTMEYVFRIRPAMNFEEVQHAAKALGTRVPDLFMVRELGEGGTDVHYHAYVVMNQKEKGARVAIKKQFKCADGQKHVSLKLADKNLLPRYFRYLCKGETSKRGDRVVVVYDSAPRMYDELHAAYHDEADTYVSEKGGKKSVYDILADECRAKKYETKEDILRVCVNHYCKSGKGFDTFMIRRTFYCVYAMVMGAIAEQGIFEEVREMIRV